MQLALAAIVLRAASGLDSQVLFCNGMAGYTCTASVQRVGLDSRGVVCTLVAAGCAVIAFVLMGGLICRWWYWMLMSLHVLNTSLAATGRSSFHCRK